MDNAAVIRALADTFVPEGEAGDAVRVRPLDDEIAGRLARPDDLRPDPGIAGLQRAIC